MAGDAETFGTLGIQFDPADPSTTIDTGAIARMENLADSPLWGCSYCAVTGTSRPAYVADHFGTGLDAAQFDGSNDTLFLYTAAAAAVDLFPTAANYPLTVAALIDPTTVADAGLLSTGSSSAGFFDSYLSGMAMTAEGGMRLAARSNSVGGGVEGGAGTITAGGGAYTMTAVLAANAAKGRINGVEVIDSSSFAISPHAAYSWDTISGTSGSGGTPRNPFAGYIGRILIYSGVLDDAALADVESYLLGTYTPPDEPTLWETASSPMILG